MSYRTFWIHFFWCWCKSKEQFLRNLVWFLVCSWLKCCRCCWASWKSGVASYLIQFISHTLNYHISYTLKPTFISHTKYKLRVQYRIHFLLFRRSRFISHTSVNFYAKFLQRSIFHANGPKRPIVSRARLLLGSRG